MSVFNRLKLYIECAHIEDKGTYYGIVPTAACAATINNWSILNKLPRPTPPRLLHCTILESQVPNLAPEPLSHRFVVPKERVSIVMFGHNLVLSFKSSTIKARYTALTEEAAKQARATRQVIIHRPLNPHIVISDYMPNTKYLAQLNAAWDLDLHFGQEFKNPLYLKNAHVFVPKPDAVDPDKEQKLKLRERIDRMSIIRERHK